MEGSTAQEGTPAHPHLATEFFVWLWYVTEREGGTVNLGEEGGVIEVFVDERISFRTRDEDKARAVLTGEDASPSLEARAAMASGKVVRDLRLRIRKEEREYSFTLKGNNLDLAGLKLPAHSPEGEDELLYERMFLYEEVWFLLRALYRRFAAERTAAEWGPGILHDMRAWVGGAPARPDPDEVEA
jgi:hypothetical protein